MTEQKIQQKHKDKNRALPMVLTAGRNTLTNLQALGFVNFCHRQKQSAYHRQTENQLVINILNYLLIYENKPYRGKKAFRNLCRDFLHNEKNMHTEQERTVFQIRE